MTLVKLIMNFTIESTGNTPDEKTYNKSFKETFVTRSLMTPLKVVFKPRENQQ